MRFLKFLRGPSVLMACFLILAIVGGPALPKTGVAFFYSISLTLKEGILFLLPFVIFAFLFSSIITFGTGAFRFLAVLLPMVVLSNGFSAFMSYIAGSAFLDYVGDLSPIPDLPNALAPLWSVTIPVILKNDQALLLSLVTGSIAVFVNNEKPAMIAGHLTNGANFILNRLFLPIMPLFVGGFLLKMGYEGTITLLYDDYAVILLGSIAIQLTYIVLFYGIGTSFNWSKWIHAIKSMAPALMAGFSTMSSASALPVTLKGAERAGADNDIARAVVPTTVNIHLLGDTLSTPLMALAVIKGFGGTLPDMATYLGFLVPFVLIRFAVAAVPGGGILMALPIFETHLHMTPPMLSLLVALYILFDPITTAMNVFGNGSFALVFQRIYKKVRGSVGADAATESP